MSFPAQIIYPANPVGRHKSTTLAGILVDHLVTMSGSINVWYIYNGWSKITSCGCFLLAYIYLPCLQHGDSGRWMYGCCSLKFKAVWRQNCFSLGRLLSFFLNSSTELSELHPHNRVNQSLMI